MTRFSNGCSRARVGAGGISPVGDPSRSRDDAWRCSLRAAMASRVPDPPDASGPARRRYAPRMPPAQRREQLIDAALGVILDHGYGGVSIEAIARTAGV